MCELVSESNMAASTATLGGISGRGTTSTKTGDMPSEPVDIVVEIEGPIDAIGNGTGWADAAGTNDGKARDPSGGGRTVFTREIPKGFLSEVIKGSEAPSKFVSFVLNWINPTTQPQGTIHIFRSGNEFVFRFECNDKQPSYRLIKSFDLVRASLKSDCT
jgi:hypothetical protein